MLEAGTRLGAYEILAPIGAGGMGEVYRARDTKLGREVAIKVLPEEFTQHPQKLARFEREARLLAALNHPKIATLYGVEDIDNQPLLIMELVEGQTLADRISQGPIPVGEALEISRQIAEALEAAHEKGVIHRDLKPANVKVDPEGNVKVLDFGLAKAFADEVPESELSQSPTLSRDATRAGVILGTAAYMSPEQAKGKTVDKRTDIFSFGMVLYEMLTGKKAFTGEDVAEVLARILTLEPDWKALPADVPPSVANLLRRCLTKDRKERLQAIGEARIAAEQYLAAPKHAAATQPVMAQAAVLPWAMTGFLTVALLVTAWMLWPPEAFPTRLSVNLGSSGEQLMPFSNNQSARAVLSPDGRTLAFVGRGAQGSQIYLRSLDNLEATPLGGTEGAFSPFFSPDGRWLAFFTSDALKKVSVSGGAVLTLAEASAGRGGTWGGDTIVYSPALATGLYRVPASGGTPVELTELQEGERRHRWPWFLPGGKAVLFMVQAESASYDDGTIEAVLLESGERKVLHRGGAFPRYVLSGHLLYIREATLFAMPFDADRIEPTGEPSPVIEGVAGRVNGGGSDYAFSDDGSLVYVPGGAVQSNSSLVWVDQEGREEPVAAEPQNYQEFTLSPDGTRLAVRIQAENSDVWIYDLLRETWTRLTFDPGGELSPLWSPDGDRVAFGSIPASWKAADGTGEVEPLVESTNGEYYPNAFSPDGTILLFEDRTSGGDLVRLSLDAERTPTPLLNTEFVERNGTLSPDGRWMAYGSNESGRFEIYVRPFPDVNAGRWQVSSDNGKWPLWAPDGRGLFYVGAEAMMRVAIESEPTFTLGGRERLFETTSYVGPNEAGTVTLRRVAISPDGQRFLMLKVGGESEDSAAPQSVILVLNWFEELKRLVPTN